MSKRCQPNPSKKVLLLTQQPLLAEQIRQVLERSSSFKLCCDAYSWIEAIAAIQRHQPDLAIIEAGLLPMPSQHIAESWKQERVLFIVDDPTVRTLFEERGIPVVQGFCKPERLLARLEDLWGSRSGDALELQEMLNTVE